MEVVQVVEHGGVHGGSVVEVCMVAVHGMVHGGGA